MKRPLSALRTGLLALFALTTVTRAWAQPLSFDLSATELSKALAQFNKQSNIPSVYIGGGGEEIRTKAVTGELEPLQALQRMLEGQDMEFTYFDDPPTIRIRRVSKPAEKPSSAETDDSPEPPIELVTVHGHSMVDDGFEMVTVTGALIRGATDVVSPLVFVTDKSLSQTSYETVPDYLYQMPQVSLDAPRQDLVANGNYGSGINLRGLGVGATLVLVNGRRLPLSGVYGDFVDVSGIPWCMVDHVEVLPDGASAIYGSDAIAGVVNIVMREHYEGAATQVRVGSGQGGPGERSVSQLFGTRWTSGQIMLAYQYSDTTPLTAASRAYAADADKRPFGGGDYRSIYSSPGNLFDPVAPGQIVGISYAQNNLSDARPILTPGSVNLENPFSQYDLFPHSISHSAYLTASQELSENIELFADALFTVRDVHAIRLPAEDTLLVPARNPYFIVLSPGAASVAVTYSFLQDLGPDTLTTEMRQYLGTMGARLRLPADWVAKLYVSTGQQELHSDEYNLPNPYALDMALSDSSAAMAFDPFSDARQNLATLQAIRLNQQLSTTSGITSENVVVDGSLGGLAGSPLKLALGFERREETSGVDVPSLVQSQYLYEPEDQYAIERHQRIDNGTAAELEVPLMSDPYKGTRVPLRLTLAERFDQYGDFGSKMSPMERLTWSPGSSIRLRASWGRSFRVPSLEELYDSSQNQLSFAYLPDPRAASGNSLALIRTGTSSELKPETATTSTVGLDLTPDFLPDFQLSVTGFWIDYYNRITQPALDDPNDILAHESEWAPFITRYPTATQVAALCESPLFNGSRQACLDSSPTVSVNYSLTNIAVTRESGIDLSLRQSLVTGWGRFRFTLDATDLLRFEQAATWNSRLQSVLNTVGNPIAFHAQTAAEWQLRTLGVYEPGARVALNHTGAYENPGSSLMPHVRSATTVDLQLFMGLNRSWPHTRVSLNIQNVLNQPPPFVDNPYGYDISNSQPLGRMLSLRVSTDWTGLSDKQFESYNWQK